MTSDQSFYAQSESEEHYTPRSIWQRAEKAMGGIDCDPASDNDFNVSSAKIHYTKRHDGLHKEWLGRIWLNPPFGPGVGDWFHKLSTEIAEGRTIEAVILWKAALETKSARTLIGISIYQCSAVPRKRVSYRSGDKKQGGGDSATFTTMLYYFGPNREKFIRIFSEIADIWEPIRTQQAGAMSLSEFEGGKE
jgi:hypothetical protein